jgi:hypothetical protein
MSGQRRTGLMVESIRSTGAGAGCDGGECIDGTCDACCRHRVRVRQVSRRSWRAEVCLGHLLMGSTPSNIVYRS